MSLISFIYVGTRRNGLRPLLQRAHGVVAPPLVHPAAPAQPRYDELRTYPHHLGSPRLRHHKAAAQFRRPIPMMPGTARQDLVALSGVRSSGLTAATCYSDVSYVYLCLCTIYMVMPQSYAKINSRCNKLSACASRFCQASSSTRRGTTFIAMSSWNSSFAAYGIVSCAIFFELLQYVHQPL